MSDQIIRELPLIKRYAKRNEDEDYRFRYYLKVIAPQSNANLDRIVKETTDYVWSQIDCLKCANCCKSMQVIVNGGDIKRMAAALNIPVREFKEKYVIPTEDGALALKSVPCVFLETENRCSVYENRPKSCRDFPYLHKSGFRQRTLSVLCNLEVCPIVFNVWDQLKQRLWRRRR